MGSPVPNGLADTVKLMNASCRLLLVISPLTRPLGGLLEGVVLLSPPEWCWWYVPSSS